VNILKIPLIFVALLSSIVLISCSKDIYFSGISEISFIEIKENYQNINYSKDDVLKIIGPPLIKENSDNLWIYRTDKKKGIAAFKQTIYNKTLKFKFEDNILRSVEEINLN
jgi:outer membrane protein assembly factor BamE (lipoprotein component of BamABCDE complex)